MKNIFKKKIVLIFLLFFSLVFFILYYFIFLNKNSEIIINKIEEKNYLKSYPEIFEKYGVIKSTYYSVNYKNLSYTCEKIVFKDGDSLTKFLESVNISTYTLNKIFFLEHNEKVSAILIKINEKPTIYYCVSYENDKNMAKNILIKLFNIK